MGHDWAVERSPLCSSETSASAGEAALLMALCVSTGRAVMLKPVLIEYIVVHELAHLTHRNHSRDFWGLMSNVIPDVQQRRKTLREAGRLLTL